MGFLGRLLGAVLPVVVGRALAAWYVHGAVFPLGRVQASALGTTVLVATVLEAVAVAAGLLSLGRPIDAALGVPENERAAAAGAASGYRLPIRVAALLFLTGGASALAGLWVLRQRGLADDLVVAAAAVGLAFAILAAMVGYSLAAAVASRAVEQLGARGEVTLRGTVRAKILAVGFGLNTIGALLFASTTYVHYRVDFEHGYVAAAARTQRGLVEAARAGGAELTEQVFRATGSPTALLGGDGAVVASAGPGGPPFERARDAVDALALPGGWLLSARTPAGAVVASWLPAAPLQRARAEFLRGHLSIALVVFGATAILAWFAASAITAPFRTLGRAADRIASGDLTASPPSVSRDEIGQLAADFRRMAQGLKTLVTDVQGASSGVSVEAREAAAIGEQVRAGAVDGHASVVAVQAAVEAMEESMGQVSRGVGGLSEYVSATTKAMGEMAAAFEEVSRQGSELERAMDAAVADVDRLGGAGRDAQTRLAHLEALAGHAGNALGAVKASMSTLERAAGESEATAELVAEMAERAGTVVEETVHGIESVRTAVADAHRRVADLGRRSDDIDQVVDFISEVAGRTNLLSLNASIIAAQAGEHGKPFGVVADQIRELAAQIARSTKSIAEIIRAVREDVQGTAALIDRGDGLAGEGVKLARNSLEALSRIRRSTVHARDTAAAIKMAVDAHAESAGEISGLVESITEGSQAVTGAVQLMGRSVTAVNQVSRGVDAMADQVARALQDQAGLGKRQIDSVGRLEQMIGHIGRAVEAHAAATRRVREALQHLSHTAGQHETAVEGLASVAERLGAGARSLAERVDRFKVN